MKALTDIPIEFKVKGEPDVWAGAYQFQHGWIKDYFFFCWVNVDHGWEHVQIALKKLANKKTNQVKSVDRSLTHEELCLVKDLFWDPEECCVVFLGPMVHYTGNQIHRSHLWRPTETGLPVPDLVFAPLKAAREAEQQTPPNEEVQS